MGTFNTLPLFQDTYSLANFSKLIVSGSDRLSFLQGQLTLDHNSLRPGLAQLSSRLDRSGRIQSCFYTTIQDQTFVLYSVSETIDHLKADLEKFIISEDVELLSLPLEDFDLKRLENQKVNPNDVVLSLGGVLFVISPRNQAQSSGMLELDAISFFTEQPILKNVEKKILINESPLSVIGLSLSKGCFLGQETASKLLVRGKNTYVPRLVLKKSDCTLLNVKDQKIEEFDFLNQAFLKLKFKNNEERLSFIELAEKKQVEYLDLDPSSLDVMSLVEKKANSAFENSLDFFHQNKYDESLMLVEQCLILNPTHLEAYELKAQILSSLNQNEKAIQTMYDLLEINPKNFMAHTNLSLFYIKLNNVEKAEEHKALAASMQMSQGSVNQQELDDRKRNEQDRRISMFEEVLEIDPEDEMALSGLATIFLERELYKKSLTYFEVLIKLKPQHLDYAFKTGINYLKAGMLDQARSQFSKSLALAKEKNDQTKCELIENYLNSIS